MGMRRFVLLSLLPTASALGLAPAAYTTDFSDASAVLKVWTQATSCEHCGKDVDGGRSECTQMSADATTFGSVKGGKGMTHTTRYVDPKTSHCGACDTSGHLTWNTPVLYGNFTVIAKWFPGDKQSVSTATGFIGLDAPGNEASITMGFHGDGWPKDDEGSHKYQHGIYADVKQTHNRGYTTTNVSIADAFNTYGLLWSPSVVEWSFNGKVVRRFDEKDAIPRISMNLRLHSRSGYCNEMPPSATFKAQFLSFQYEPLS